MMSDGIKALARKSRSRRWTWRKSWTKAVSRTAAILILILFSASMAQAKNRPISRRPSAAAGSSTAHRPL